MTPYQVTRNILLLCAMCIDEWIVDKCSLENGQGTVDTSGGYFSWFHGIMKMRMEILVVYFSSSIIEYRNVP